MTSLEIEHRINPPDYDQVYIGRCRLLVAMGLPDNFACWDA
jgi:hypothetical protein